MRLRTIFLLCALTFTITLAVVVGVRLSEQAMAVVVGVVAGVAASIPTSLIVTWVATRNALANQPPATPHTAAPTEERPPVIFVQAPPAPLPYDRRFLVPPATPQPRRAFNILGGEDD
jgi:hypothetical protein